MSVIIKGMKMPKQGQYVCVLKVSGKDKASIDLLSPTDKSERICSYAVLSTDSKIVDADQLQEDIEELPVIEYHADRWMDGDLFYSKSDVDRTLDRAEDLGGA